MNYDKITTEFTDKFFKLVEDAKNIVITSHFSPDGDSISCVLSMYRIISDKYKDKNVRIVYSNELDEHFSYFNNFEKIEWVDDVANHVDGCDLLILLDAGALYRFTRYADTFPSIKNTICIDHHASKPDEFTISTIIPEMSSCSELIFKLFEKHITLDKNLAETFLLGILTDTGNFIFLDSSQSETLSIAKKLVDAGDININTFRSKYSSITKREFYLVQELIKNASLGEVAGWPAFNYTYFDRDFVENGKYTNNELNAANTSYIASYLTSLENYTWGFIIKPKSTYCAVSVRSLPESVNAKDILERMYLGGGHDRAAGGVFKDILDPKVCVEQIIEWMKNNKPLLN